MTPTEAHATAAAQTQNIVAVVMTWVAEADRALKNETMDATSRARIGELLINAVRFMDDREAALQKAARFAQLQAASAQKRA